jgi:MYXO-CTERM domain-containing protein
MVMRRCLSARGWHRRVAGAFIVSALGATQPALVRLAAACSPPACGPAYLLPADGATVPANVPAFFFVLPYGTTPPARSEDVRLLDEGGRLVPISTALAPPSAGYTIVPGAPLMPGRQYRLRFPQGCAGGASGNALGTAERAFLAGPASALPTTIGTARVTGRRIGPRTVSSSSGSPGLCSSSTEVTAAVATIEIDPSPELRAYLATAVVAVHRGADGLVFFNGPVLAADQPLRFEVYTTCASADPGASRGLGSGLHRLEVTAEVFGAVSKPSPLLIDVELGCDAQLDAGSSDGSPDAGSPDVIPDARSAPDAVVDARVSADQSAADATPAPNDDGPAAATMPKRANGGCACRLDQSAPPTAASTSLIFVLGLLVLRRRRHRSR